MKGVKNGMELNDESGLWLLQRSETMKMKCKSRGEIDSQSFSGKKKVCKVMWLN